MQQVGNIKNCGECRHLVSPAMDDRMRGSGFMKCPYTEAWVYLSPFRAPLMNGGSCPHAEQKQPEELIDLPGHTDYDLFGESVHA